MVPLSVNRQKFCLIAVGILLIMNPSLQAQRCRFTGRLANPLGNTSEEERVNYREKLRIPIVFNVLYENDVENISDNQLLSQLEVLNEDFSASNVDRKQLSAPWKRLSTDAGIQFCMYMGTEAPNGIRRKRVNPDIFGDSFSIHFTDKGGLDAILPTQVLNVWVFTQESTIAGYANPVHEYPLAVSGVVVDPRFVGRLGTAIDNQPYHLGRTLTHEIGHFFGLRHVWGNISGECDEDDGIEDTPLQSEALYGCPMELTGCNTEANVNNFMNLVDDPCMYMFTEGQTAHMKSYLKHYLPAFEHATMCNSQPIAYFLPIQDPYVVFPNPSPGYFILQNTLNQNTRFRLFDSSGKLLLEESGDRAFFSIGADLTSGLYFLQIQAKTGSQGIRVLIQ